MWATKVRGDVANFDAVFGDGRGGFNFKIKFNGIVIGHISPTGLVH